MSDLPRPSLYDQTLLIYRDLFPRNVERMCWELSETWAREAHATGRLPRDRAFSFARLRARAKTLKSDGAIVKWLREEAPLPHLLLSCHAIGALLAELSMHPSGPAHDRLRLKLRLTRAFYRQHRMHDAILAGLDILHAQPGPVGPQAAAVVSRADVWRVLTLEED